MRSIRPRSMLVGFGALVVLSAAGPVNFATAGAVTRTAEQQNVTTTDTDGDGKLDAITSAEAATSAAAQGEPVEDLSKRTETAQTFANPNGTFTAEIYPAPVRIEDSDGSWQKVDLDLTKKPDGSWAPKVSPTDVTVDGGSSKEAVRVTFETGESLAVTWPTRLPTPTVKGGVATYKLSGTTSLVVATTLTGANAHIVLSAPPADDDPVFELGLRAEGADVTESAGGLKIGDGDGKTIGTTSHLVAWDADTDASGDPTTVVPLEADLETVSENGDVTTSTLSLTTPDEFLSDPTTTYPVTIDPNIASVNRDADTWMRSGNASQGGDFRLISGKLNGSSNTNPARAYQLWDISAFAGKNVLYSQLDLWQYYAYDCSNRLTNVWAVTSPWSTGTTWPDRPSMNSTSPYLSTSFGNTRGASGCSQSWATAVTTNLAKGWASGSVPNYGVALVAGDETRSSYERRFCSANPASGTDCYHPDFAPRLSVNYTSYPATASTPAVSVSGSEVTVSSKVSDADGGQVKAKFQVKDLLGNEVYKGYSSYVNSGGTATLLLPRLRTGNYTVKAWGNDGSLESLTGSAAKSFYYRTSVQVGATFEDGSTITYDVTSGVQSVAAPSGVNVLTSEAGKVNGEGLLQLGVPDVPAELGAPSETDFTIGPDDVEDSTTEVGGLPNVEGEVGEVIGAPSIQSGSTSAASNVPMGYKLYGNNRVDSTHYKSRKWYLWHSEWEGNWIFGGWVKKAEVDMKYAQTLNGGSSRLWNLTTEVRWKFGYRFDYKYTAWCGVVRRNARDETCKTKDSTADPVDEEDLVCEWVAGYGCGTDRWYDIGKNHTGYAKYPLIRFKVSWYTDDGDMSTIVAKARGWDARHKTGWKLASATGGDQATYSVSPG